MRISIYPIVQTVIIISLLVFIALMLARLLFNYSDPNPFGKTGRFALRFRKLTERFVYPAARFLATFGIDVRLAPILTILIASVLVYFVLGIIFDIFYIVDGLTAGIINNNLKVFAGFFLYAVISFYIMLVFLRVLSSWFVFTKKTLFGFVRRMTDPAVLPLQKLIPPIGMFDLSAMILLILLSLLQRFVMQIFVFGQ
ncbi:MAG TPA: YggT family protein [Pyrinomonadaceae bacterium]|jgi:YggT family protein|nr:YggT family protein [Pyrinomonadaceae bacterium]